MVFPGQNKWRPCERSLSSWSRWGLVKGKRPKHFALVAELPSFSQNSGDELFLLEIKTTGLTPQASPWRLIKPRGLGWCWAHPRSMAVSVWFIWLWAKSLGRSWLGVDLMTYVLILLSKYTFWIVLNLLYLLIYPPLIKHGLLENPPFSSMKFPATNLLFRRFSIATFDNPGGYFTKYLSIVGPILTNIYKY